MMKLAHATAVRVKGAGVLLRGPSGAGKSDLALRLIHDGAILVADDYVELTVADGRLLARPPKAIRGLLEVRGIGILTLPFAAEASIACLIDLAPSGEPERLPEPLYDLLLGVRVRAFRLDPFTVSAAAKVAAAVSLCDNPALNSEPRSSS
jgi:serine kinase of HPr protein (carbohydrate metabolism regulator)